MRDRLHREDTVKPYWILDREDAVNPYLYWISTTTTRSSDFGEPFAKEASTYNPSITPFTETAIEAKKKAKDFSTANTAPTGRQTRSSTAKTAPIGCPGRRSGKSRRSRKSYSTRRPPSLSGTTARRPWSGSDPGKARKGTSSRRNTASPWPSPSDISDRGAQCSDAWKTPSGRGSITMTTNEFDDDSWEDLHLDLDDYRSTLKEAKGRTPC